MAKNQCFRLEQRFVIKFLVAEKCKSLEIYRWICDVYGEAYFSQNMGLPESKRQFFQWKHQRSSKEKVSGIAVIKGRAWKSAPVNRAKYSQFLWQNSPYLLNDPGVSLYIYVCHFIYIYIYITLSQISLWFMTLFITAKNWTVGGLHAYHADMVVSESCDAF